MTPSHMAIVQATCDACEVSTRDVLGHRRFRELADARAIIWTLQADLRGAIKSYIARQWEVDHSTILHGIKRTKRLVRVDPGFRLKFTHAQERARMALEAF